MPGSQVKNITSVRFILDLLMVLCYMCTMKILVCVKQVIDTESPLVVDQDAAWVRDDGKVARRMNRYDEYALEEAVRIREEFPDTVIDVITMGPEGAGAVALKGLEKGADHAVHLRTGSGGYLPPGFIASEMAKVAGDRDYQLVITGFMSEDCMHAQVGPLLASMLGIPSAVAVVQQTVDTGGGSIEVACELEGGARELVGLELPALVTVQTGINTPRYPKLSDVLRAQDQEIEVMDVDDGSVKAAMEGCPYRLLYPPEGARGVVMEGTAEEKADRLIEILHEHSVL